MPALAAALLSAAFLLAYFPDLGHGFVKDDFAWIVHARLQDGEALRRILLDAPTFYRPLVTLSFAINEWLFGFNAFGYGLTNLALAGACAAAVGWLARSAGLPAGAALMAAALWAFNFHGINMALLWISGRTALCLTLFAVLAARAAMTGGRAQVFGFSLLAVLSKEEAVLLPLLCAVMAAWPRGGPSPPPDPSSAGAWLRRGWAAAWPSSLAVAFYLALRAQSGAFTPASAPPFYRFTFAPADVFENLLHYADRSATLAAIAAIAAILVAGRRPVLDAEARRIAGLGVVWVAVALAVTVWLPVRSSLYAVWPSVGAALAASALAAAVWPAAAPRRRRAMVTAALVLPFLLWPVYRSRNVRWVELADLTRDALGAVGAEAARIPDGSMVVLRDDRSTRASFNNAFGALVPEAAALAFGSRFTLWIDPPPDDLQGVERPSRPVAATFALSRGGVKRVE